MGGLLIGILIVALIAAIIALLAVIAGNDAIDSAQNVTNSINEDTFKDLKTKMDAFNTAVSDDDVTCEETKAKLDEVKSEVARLNALAQLPGGVKELMDKGVKELQDEYDEACPE